VLKTSPAGLGRGVCSDFAGGRPGRSPIKAERLRSKARELTVLHQGNQSNDHNLRRSCGVPAHGLSVKEIIAPPTARSTGKERRRDRLWWLSWRKTSLSQRQQLNPVATSHRVAGFPLMRAKAEYRLGQTFASLTVLRSGARYFRQFGFDAPHDDLLMRPRRCVLS